MILSEMKSRCFAIRASRLVTWLHSETHVGAPRFPADKAHHVLHYLHSTPVIRSSFGQRRHFKPFVWDIAELHLVSTLLARSFVFRIRDGWSEREYLLDFFKSSGWALKSRRGSARCFVSAWNTWRCWFLFPLMKYDCRKRGLWMLV